MQRAALDQTLVDSLKAHIDVHDHEGQKIHEQPHENGELVVQHGEGRFDQADFDQDVVDQSRIPHDIDPTHRADDEADPKGEHDQEKKNLLVPAFAAVEKIGGYITHNQTQEDGFKGDPDRPDENFGVEEVFEELGVIAQLKSWNIRPAGCAQPEAVYDDKKDGNHQK